MTQPEFPDLLALLNKHAAERPEVIAVVDGTREVSYRQFVADIDRVARRLNTSKLVPGNRAILFFRSPYLHWLATLALMRLGVITVSMSDLSRQDTLQMLGAHVLVTERGSLKAEGGNMIAMGEDWLTDSADSLPALPSRAFDPKHPVRITLSSGTTGLSKKILYDNTTVGARIFYATKDYGFSSQHRFMSGVGIETTGGYIFSVSTWANGGSVACFDATRPLGSQLEQNRANLLFMSPVQAANMVESLPEHFLPSERTLIVAGGRLPQAVAQRVRQKLASTIWIVYGSTEAGSVARTFEPDYARPEAVGTLVTSAQVQIVDAKGLPVPAGTVGEVRTRGPCSVDRYLDDPEASRAFFRDGWFYPGDLGTLSTANELCIVGRVGDLMNLGGVKIAPGAIEDVLADCPGVKDLAAFSVPDELGVESLWIAVTAGEGFSEDALRQRYVQRFPNRLEPSIALVGSIPRNAMSKVQRNQLREAVAQQMLVQQSNERAGGPAVLFGFRELGTGSADTGAAANQENKVATVKINDKEYDFDKLPDEVKAQLASVQFIDAELHRMNLHRAALQTARGAYMKSVGELLNK